MSIKACLKEKMGYSKFYYNPEITKIHNNADARVEKPFSSSMGDFFKPCPSRAKAGFKKSPSG
jgi:hypothetical protein